MGENLFLSRSYGVFAPLFSGRCGGFAAPPHPCLPKTPRSATEETHGLLAADPGILGGQTRVFFSRMIHPARERGKTFRPQTHPQKG